MKKTVILTLIIFSIFLLSACNQGSNAKNTIKPLTIGVMPDVESIPLLIAEKNGYYEKEGVQIKIEHFKSARDRDSALQSGKLDGAISDMLAVVFAKNGGISLKITSLTDGGSVLLAGKASGIDSVSRIKGKSVGISTNTIMEYSFDRMLEAASVNVNDVKKIAIPQIPARLEMLQNGKTDAAVMPEPLAGLAAKNGAVILNSTGALGIKAGVLAFTSKTANENPDVIKAFYRAYNDAVSYLLKEPASSFIDYIIQVQGFPEEVRNSIKLPEYNRARIPATKDFSDVVRWMKGRGLIKENFEYKDLVDSRFVE